MNAVSEIEPTAGTTGATPGELLRDERERRGLTVQQVSEELHLDTWLIDALEENRFLALGAPVYAKGHLRKYAVLLGLPPDLILSRYQAIATPSPPPPPPAEALITPPTERRIDLRRLDWRMYAIIGGLALSCSGVGWLVAQSGRTATVATPSGKPAAAPAQAADATPPVQSESSNMPGSEAEPPPAPTAIVAAPPPAPARASEASPPPQERSTPVSPPPTIASRSQPSNPSKVQAPVASVPRPANPTDARTPSAIAPTSAPPVQARVSPPPQAQSPVVTPKPPASAPVASVRPPVQPPATAVQPTPQPAPTVQTAKTATPPLAMTVPPNATTPPAEAGPQVSLRLEFTMASWAEVYDGDGRRLMYAIGDPNKPRTVSGKAPLKVTLGTAGSVQARVNGRPIAIPRRIGQESATFSVNANGSIRLR